MPSMQYDVLAAKELTSSGKLQDQHSRDLGRIRIKGIYGISGGAVGSVVFHDGATTAGKILMVLPTPEDTNSGTFWLPLPGEGILAENGVYVDITDVASVVVIYG
jgi:hypothetical protein